MDARGRRGRSAPRIRCLTWDAGCAWLCPAPSRAESSHDLRNAREGDTILDPFCGCGTTVAALWLRNDCQPHLAPGRQRDGLRAPFHALGRRQSCVTEGTRAPVTENIRFPRGVSRLFAPFLCPPVQLPRAPRTACRRHFACWQSVWAGGIVAFTSLSSGR
jgi:hypothetical protein